MYFRLDTLCFFLVYYIPCSDFKPISYFSAPVKNCNRIVFFFFCFVNICFFVFLMNVLLRVYLKRSKKNQLQIFPKNNRIRIELGLVQNNYCAEWVLYRRHLNLIIWFKRSLCGENPGYSF